MEFAGGIMKSISVSILIIFVALTSFLVCGCGNSSNGYSGGPSNSGASIPSGAVEITIPSGATGRGPAAYGTNPLHVPMNSVVVWRNSDGMAHTATSDSGIFDTGTISAAGVSKVVTFNNAGTFPYHCTIHGAASMSGVIVVP
jgi:plastocyanin